MKIGGLFVAFISLFHVTEPLLIELLYSVLSVS